MDRLRPHLPALALAAMLGQAACGGGATSTPAPPDTTPPAAPTLSTTSPASPSSDSAPHLIGTAEAGATVRAYASAACTGTPVATGAAAAGGTFDLTVAAAPNATTPFTATATDAAGNVSPCSSPFSYLHDGIAPAAPALAGTAPATPSNDAAPHVTGTAEAAATIRVYATATCTGSPLATGVTTPGGTFDLVAAATQNATTLFRATATDAAGNASPCSSPLSYVHDGIAPAVPALAGTTPASPSSNPTPHVTGTADAGATVWVYASAACSGSPVASGTATGGAFDLAVAVAANAVTNLTATAADAAGNVSACSAALAYRHDDVAPAAPVLAATSPTSPSSNATPHVTGSAESGATVRVYGASSCGGVPLAIGTATGGTFDLAVTVAPNATTALSATASDAVGNVSGCSGALSYQHDDQPPAAPSLSATNPASPSSVSSPHLLGAAEPGATIRVYATAGCTGPPLATGTASGGAFDLVVAATQNATTAFRATAADAAGNLSPCSAPLSYVHDGIAPATPAIAGTTPASPSSDPNPHLTGNAEAGATVRVYANAACTGAPLASGVAAGGAFDLPIAVTPNAVTTLAATATDAAGNVSGCSASTTYLHDGIAPVAPTVVASVPASPSSDPTPHLTGSAEAASTVRFFDTPACSGAPLAVGTASSGGTFDLAVPAAPNASRTFRATVTDAAGNASPCSGPFTYLHDDVAPPAPALSGTTPTSPSQSLTPTVDGTAEPGAALRLYAGAGCSGAPLAQGYADGLGAVHLQFTATADATTRMSATAQDAAGNTSACSATLDYVQDDVAPAPPVLAGSSPASPANENAPSIQGFAEPGSTVTLFTDALCAGAVAASGAAAGDGAFAIGVSVADNTTTTFRAQATDATGNASGCSATSVAYVEESRTLTVSPASLELDPDPSPLSTVTFAYALGGGPDAGVAWTVDEPGGGTIDADGNYRAPARTGTYHVTATTLGALPALAAHAAVVVRSPVIRGSIAYAGNGPGRIFVSVTGGFGGPAIGGTSVAVPGPGTYPYTVRGLVATGSYRVSAWYDAAGAVRWIPAVDPSGHADVVLAGSSLSGVDLALVAPAPASPGAPGLDAVFPTDGAIVVPFDPPRDANGLELADGYDVSCTTGVPPALPGPGAVHVPPGSDGVAFVRGLANGSTYTCSAWSSNHGVRSAPAVSGSVVAGSPAGGFTVSGTISFSGPAPSGPAYVVLLDRSAFRARIARYAAPSFPLAYSVTGVPAGDWVLGLVVDTNDDGAIAPTEFNSLSGGPSDGLPMTVSGDLAGQDATFSRTNARARALVSYHTGSGGDAYDLYLVVGGNARLPATSVVTGGPDVLPPVDMGASGDGGDGVSLTASRSLGAAPPAPGTYFLDVTYTDSVAEQLSASVSAASLLSPPTPLAPGGGGSAAPQPVFSWAEPIPAPPGPYAYRISVYGQAGGGLWNSDDIVPGSRCSGGTCEATFGFDGRASLPLLAPGDYQWDVAVRDASGNEASTSTSFHVPVDVTVDPPAASLYPGEATLLTASVTGSGSVTWSASCGSVTPRADPLQADYVALAPGPCTVTATSTAEPARSGSAAVTVLPIGVAVAPSPVALEPGQVQVFTAAVTGPGSVTWSADCGTLSSAGDPLARRYAAPATGPCTVTATSDVQLGSAGSATISIASTPQLQPDPVIATLNPGQTQSFVAKLGGVPVAAAWVVSEAGGGTVSPDGLYLAPPGPGLFHVVATDGNGRSATAVVQVVDPGGSPQPSVTISPPSAIVVAQGSAGFGASVQGCVDQSVSWSVREAGAGNVSPSGPSSATYQAPWGPGTYHLVARAACDPTKTAVATVTVRLPSVSGTIGYAGAAGGRIFVALVTNWGDVVSGTSLPGPGAFVLRGIQPGSYVLRAWRDSLGVVTFQPNLEPYAELPVSVTTGGDLTGATLDLVDASPSAPPAPASASAFPGDGGALVFVDRVEDPSRNSLADGYHLSCDTVPASGSPVIFLGTLADEQAFMLRAANGTTWSCDAWATAGGLASATVSSGEFTIGAPTGGQTVSGTVTAQGTPPSGPLSVVLYNPAIGVFTQRFSTPEFPQTFSVAGVPDGQYQVGAVLDRDDDGVMARTDPVSFRNGGDDGGPTVEVAGGAVSGVTIALAFSDAATVVATSRFVGTSENYDLQLVVDSNLRVPRQVTLTGGPGVSSPVDLGVDSNQGGGNVRLRTRVGLGSVAPRAGDAYDLAVTWDDGTTATLQAHVTAVLEPPTPLSPVDPLGSPLTAPAVPVFSWGAPGTLPATPYTWSVYVSQGASWNLWDVPAAQLEATYGDLSPGAPPALPAALPAGVYRWIAGVRDANGNSASREATFTVSPP